MRLLLPREHGAYAQLGFPLACALIIGAPTLGSAALAIAAMLAFWAHEPLLLLLGRRGERLREELGGRARRVLGLLLAGLLALLGAAAALAELRWLPLPGALGALALLFALKRWERTAPGEVLAALALTSWSVPVAVAGGAGARLAVETFLAFALGFAVATLAVRAAIAQGKGEGWGKRLSAGVVAIFAMALAISLAALGALPLLLFALFLALFPPHPRHLRRVGWGLVATAGLATALLARGGAR